MSAASTRPTRLALRFRRRTLTGMRTVASGFSGLVVADAVSAGGNSSGMSIWLSRATQGGIAAIDG
jgi:hypothetical protein